MGGNAVVHTRTTKQHAPISAREKRQKMKLQLTLTVSQRKKKNNVKCWYRNDDIVITASLWLMLWLLWSLWLVFWHNCVKGSVRRFVWVNSSVLVLLWAKRGWRESTINERFAHGRESTAHKESATQNSRQSFPGRINADSSDGKLM